MTSAATTQPTTRRAAIYTRISLDSTGEGLGVERQRESAEQLAAQRDWAVSGVFTDNSVSAAGTKTRPGFAAMLAAIERGEVDAVICWALDRLARNARDRLALVDACREHGTIIALVKGSDMDPTTASGRAIIGILGEVAQMEIEQKGERQRAANLQRVSKGGAPRGVRLMGYSTKGETIPAEAAIVRRIFALFDSGESLHGIARTLNDDGVPTRRGGKWALTSVRNTLTNPRYCGRTFYHGEVLEGVRGHWEPLVSEEQFDLIQATLSDPLRKTRRAGTERKYLGSGLYRCDLCGAIVNSWSNGTYRCSNACVHRSRNQVDTFVTDIITERLSRPDLAELLASGEDALAPLLDETKRLRDRLATIDADYDAGHIDGVRYRRATEKVRAELATTDRQLASQRTSSALGSVVASPDPAAAFRDAPLMARRAVIDALCTVRLRKGTRGSRVFDPATVVIEWRS